MVSCVLRASWTRRLGFCEARCPTTQCPTGLAPLRTKTRPVLAQTASSTPAAPTPAPAPQVWSLALGMAVYIMAEWMVASLPIGCLPKGGMNTR